jgi:hypothetical protein
MPNFEHFLGLTELYRTQNLFILNIFLVLQNYIGHKIYLVSVKVTKIINVYIFTAKWHLFTTRHIKVSTRQKIISFVTVHLTSKSTKIST